MAFFDNFSKKASDVASKTVLKTQNLAEITKLNSQVSAEERKMENVYNQIGKMYVSLHRADSEEQLSDFVKTILESEQKISELQKNIQDIRGVLRCEKCGAEVPRGAAFCSACGAPMPKDKPDVIVEDYVKCSRCGASVKRGMRFCTSCGNAMYTEESCPAETKSNEED